ncbi:hypothetical protein [Streptomyces sp. Ag109_G2-15]|uniref:hypothetical protein n=1 Tax=Streptomyces sp. Ag109_G2-15 TaxID=1938850 RepID=UPI000BCB616F|nr:hypothetical protein [Streptomyces sp. Ag109_G2-15]SOE06921.1 hypothetical protein SAMN06272765_7794 [Streptomyces sp. Ag109_G2-15]
MTKISSTGTRAGMVPLVLLAVLAAGCGTQRAGDDAGAGGPSRSAVATPSTPTDSPCPGESPAPSPKPSTATPSPTAPPTDHYAENHGFMVPFELHGKRRCQGLAVVGRVRKALEPLRTRGQFNPESVRKALVGLGYSGGQVQTYQSGGGVGFLVQVDDYPVCVEGSLQGTPTLDGATTEADAFGGYPDHDGCDQPSGGH